jgi:hypothetical protein
MSAAPPPTLDQILQLASWGWRLFPAVRHKKDSVDLLVAKTCNMRSAHH